MVFLYVFSVGWAVVSQLEQAIILTTFLKNPENSSNIGMLILFVIKRPVAIPRPVLHTFKNSIIESHSQGSIKTGYYF